MKMIWNTVENGETNESTLDLTFGIYSDNEGKKWHFISMSVDENGDDTVVDDILMNSADELYARRDAVRYVASELKEYERVLNKRLLERVRNDPPKKNPVPTIEEEVIDD